jgi:hypothetical protein
MVDVQFRAVPSPKLSANPVLTWRLNGTSARTDATTLSCAGQQCGSAITFAPAAGETVVACEIAGDGWKQAGRFRVYGQEMTTAPIRVDGRLDDWNDPPVVRLWPAKQRTPLPDDSGFEGIVRVLWSESHLYLGIETRNSSGTAGGPATSSGRGRKGGDVFEIRMGFNTKTAAPAKVGSGMSGETRWDKVLRLGVGHEPGRDTPIVWKEVVPAGQKIAAAGKRVRLGGAKAAVETTNTGRTYEVAVPVKELGIAVRENRPLALDMRLDGEIDGKPALFWGGNEAKWNDPGSWGLAVILPNPETLPRTKRQQLFGGNTDRKLSESAATDTAFLTPLPVEKPEATEHLSPLLSLKVPIGGEVSIGGCYGYENPGWTHQTIGNAGSANDFFAVDFDVPRGTPVLAAADGTIVTSSLRGDSYGNYIVVDHGNGYHTIYAHLDSLQFRVDKGEPEIRVRQGGLLGYSGNSGTRLEHLHFGVHRDARISHSGASIGARSVVPEPLDGYYGLRKGHVLKSTNTNPAD